MTENEQIKFIIDECDFVTIHNIMKLMNITWSFHNKPKSVPTVDDLIAKSKDLLEEVKLSTEIEDVVSFSGIEAHKIESILELRFVPVRSNPLSNLFN